MISHLFSAISIAIMSSVLAIGGVKSDSQPSNVLVDGTSWVYGSECTQIYQTNISHHFTYSSTVSTYFTYGFDGTNYDDDALQATMIKNQRDSLDSLYEQYATDNPVDSVTWWYSTSGFASNGVVYPLSLRFFVPNNDITGIEFRSNLDFLLFKGDMVGSSLLHKATYTRNQLTYRYSYGLYDSSFVSSKGESTTPISVSTSSNYFFPSRFSEYLLVFTDGGSAAHWSLDLDLDVQFISGGEDLYSDGFQTGYSQGYSAGNNIGYHNGYTAGYNAGSSQSGTFMSLFSSIADTPLRFIYGLFNFDLFGVSVLVIVLSLLTFTLVFAIVKKLWK